MPSRSVTSAAARVVHALLPPHDGDDLTSESSAYAVGVAFTPQRAAVVRDGGATRLIDLAPGTVGLNGPTPLTWLRTSGASESLEIVPTAAALAAAADEHGARWEQWDSYGTHGRDPVVWAAAAVARRALLTDTLTPARIDELVTGVLAHVAGRYAGGRVTARGPLDTRRVLVVTERVHADPWAPHPLAELAGTVHLSRFHFLRSFRLAVGITPHQFVDGVRAERLRRMLAADRATVASVSTALGLDARHLRRLHRRGIGVAPRDR